MVMNKRVINSCAFLGCHMREIEICVNNNWEELIDYKKVNYEFCENDKK